MREKLLTTLECRRVTAGPMASSREDGRNGAFVMWHNGVEIYMVCSDQLLWEHVSVSVEKNRCPTWEEMCWVKDLFWHQSEVVIQYHPAKSEYVNCHPYCLHLWKPVGVDLPVPDSIMVGQK